MGAYAHVVHVSSGCRFVLLDQIPLVDGEEERLAGIHRGLGDFEVLRAKLLRGVEKNTHNVGALDGLDAAECGVEFERLMDTRGAPETGGVDQGEARALVIENRIDRIACGARLRRDDHALFAEQTVDQRRLADIGASDDGERNRIIGHFFVVFSNHGKNLYETIKQVAGRTAVESRDADWRYGSETGVIEHI